MLHRYLLDLDPAGIFQGHVHEPFTEDNTVLFIHGNGGYVAVVKAFYAIDELLFVRAIGLLAFPWLFTIFLHDHVVGIVFFKGLQNLTAEYFLAKVVKFLL